MAAKHYPGFALICFSALMLRTILEQGLSGHRPSPLPTRPKCWSSESCLAFGARYPINAADTYDFELIPGLSTLAASELARRKAEVCRAGQRLENSEEWRAYLLVPGIGPKNAHNLASAFQISRGEACQG